jgi:hypothetical protein
MDVSRPRRTGVLPAWGVGACAGQDGGIVAAAFGVPALSQGTPQTLSIMKIDPASLATGYRTSKVVGSTVVNETNETVGTIDDLIVTPGDKVPFAVLSVGGFLGMGTKFVVVRTTRCKCATTRWCSPAPPRTR